MKRVIALCLLLVVCISITACGEVSPATMQPQVTQMRAICELATMECYYHNVAKYFKEGGTGLFGFEKKDKHFWMEYSGKVIIGVDASLITLEIDDTNVKITMPPAYVKDCTVDSESLSKDSYIVAKNSDHIKAEDQTKAVEEAQEVMKTSAEGDAVLLANAQQRAQLLIEDYVYNIGNAFGVEYTITWVYVDESGNPLDEAISTELPTSDSVPTQSEDTD